MIKDLVWLHIGMHKTGSSALQEGLHGYDDGVTRYARLGIANHSLLIRLLFNLRPGQQKAARRGGLARLIHPFHRMWGQRALRRALANGPPRLILSAESISHFDLPSMTGLAAFLTRQAREVRVLVYVRDPVSYAGSAFQQRVRGGASEMKLAVPSFRKVLNISFTAFGRDAVEVVEYNRQTFGAGGVLADAGRRMGLKPFGGPAPRTNESLSAGAVGLLYFWNRTPAAVAGSWRQLAARREMIQILAKALPGTFRLAPTLASRSVDPTDLDWLRRQTGIDFRACLTLQDVPGDIACEADLKAAHDAALPALIAHLHDLGLKDLPTQADAAMTRLFDHTFRQTSRLPPVFKHLFRRR